MKLMLLPLVLVAVLGVHHVCSEEKYTTKYDNIDMDEVLNNQRLFKKYLDCIMDRGRCTPDGRELKDRLKEAMRTDCVKCSDQQRAGMLRVLKHLSIHKPHNLKEVMDKYDSDGTFRKSFKKEADKHGIKLPPVN